MSIPSLTGIVLSLGPFPLTGPLFLLVGGALLFLMARQVFLGVRARLRQPRRESGAGQAVAPLAFAGLMAFSIGAFHAYDSARALGNASWWRIIPEQIAEIEVVRVPEMNKPPVGPPVYLSDPALLRDGFRRLADARFYLRHAEIYQDGYRLRLRLVGEEHFSERYLFVYHRSNDKPRCPAVVFDRGLPEEGDEALHQAGEFLSPAFLEWVDDVVAPRLAEPRR
jgi:hypothetical protein